VEETVIKKAWGTEKILASEPEYTGKILHIHPGKKSSLHYHTIKKETFNVRSGLVRLEHGENDELLTPGEQRTILPQTPHRFSSKFGATIIEISTHHEDADCTRLELSGEM
jgi:mannose-6-phosphate isomerase-like protein (cupin superfamily)